MASTEEARSKISETEKICEIVLVEAAAALTALTRGISVNGYGIFHDYLAVRRNLREALGHIQKSLNVLDQAAWPTESDYDQV